MESTLRQRVYGSLGFAIAELAPLPLGPCALRQPDAIGRFVRPFRQRRRDMFLIGLERNPRLQDDDAIGPPLDRNVALQPIDLAKARLGHHRSRIPIHIASPGIRSFADPWSLVRSYSYRLI